MLKKLANVRPSEMFVGFMWFMYPINIHVNLMGLFNNSGYVIPIIVVIYGYMMGL